MHQLLARRPRHRGCDLVVHAPEVEPGTHVAVRRGRQLVAELELESKKFDASGRHHCRLPLEGLEPGTRYEAEMHGPRGKLLARAGIDTLPDRLPGPDEPGYRIWTSSCFHGPRAASPFEAMVDECTRDLAHRPKLNFHLGDQVYLDGAWWQRHAHLRADGLAPAFARSYRRNWCHPGYAKLLASTGNHFLADDHEYWSNFPHPPAPWPWRRAAHYRRWFRAAQSLCELYQDPHEWDEFRLGESLDVFVLPCRRRRSFDGQSFTTNATMSALERWLDDRERPGMLVSSQPIVSAAGSRFDRTLANYGDYASRLLPALRRSRADLICLAGDCHHGHCVRVDLGGHGRGPWMTEVVSSPLALVQALAGRMGSDRGPSGPPEFGDRVERLERARIRRRWPLPATLEHAVLVDLRRGDSGRVAVTIERRYVTGERGSPVNIELAPAPNADAKSSETRHTPDSRGGR